MLQNNELLNIIDELLYEIIDSDNNVIYPTEKEKVNFIDAIIADYKPNNLIYFPKENKWYKYYTKSFEKDNNKYLLKYLIDVTEIKKEEEKYQIDSLTSVLTRSTILENLIHEVTECTKNNIPFSVVIGDVDLFKEVNDKYGHIAGDKVLKNIGNILLKNTIDADDLVGRYGGEEFLFFFKNTTLEETINKITKVKKSLDKLIIKYDSNEIKNITMSFGVYYINNLYKENTINQKIITDLIHCADVALYESKRSGRNQTHIYTNPNLIKKIDYK